MHAEEGSLDPTDLARCGTSCNNPLTPLPAGIEHVDAVDANVRLNQFLDRTNSPAVGILCTGGTFDKVYNPVTERFGFDQKTHVGEMLKQARVNLENLHIEQLFLKDSLDLTADDREKILVACKAAKEKRLVITHGTSTMLRTASFVAEAQLPKIIMLVGAFFPPALKNSDAQANLLFALGAARSFPKDGVYVAIHGVVFPWDQVRKNPELARFEWIP